MTRSFRVTGRRRGNRSQEPERNHQQSCPEPRGKGGEEQRSTNGRGPAETRGAAVWGHGKTQRRGGGLQSKDKRLV